LSVEIQLENVKQSRNEQWAIGCASDQGEVARWLAERQWVIRRVVRAFGVKRTAMYTLKRHHGGTIKGPEDCDWYKVENGLLQGCLSSDPRFTDRWTARFRS